MHPYSEFDKSSFWEKSVTRASHDTFNPVINPKFKILDLDTKIATAGSCFAQHISKYLNAIGIPQYIVEESSLLSSKFREKYQYGIFSARYGNIYSSRQLKQLFDRAFNLYDPLEKYWPGKRSAFIDPFRQSITNGFQTIDELLIDQKKHLKCVRDMFTNLDIFIFTLGLTEIWRLREDGAVYQSAPGILGGFYDSNKYEFYNLTVNDVYNDINYFASSLKKINPNVKILLTVSPVPLAATASNRHVLNATIYSKSVLRVATEMLVQDCEFIDYFPSYEIVTGPQRVLSGGFFQEDLRNIKPEGVDFIMNLFIKNYISNDVINLISKDKKTEDHFFKDLSKNMDIICEELLNDVAKTNP